MKTSTRLIIAIVFTYFTSLSTLVAQYNQHIDLQRALTQLQPVQSNGLDSYYNPSLVPPQDPDGYTESYLPPQTNLNLVVDGRTFSHPTVELLKKLYGEDYKTSVYYRAQEALKNDTEIARHIAKLQATRGTDINFNIHYDKEDSLLPGETVSHFDRQRKMFSYVRVQKGDTLESIAKRLGTTKEELLKDNKSRFNISPHAKSKRGIVNIGESWRDYPNDVLNDALAHEAAHTVDGTTYFGLNYGNDGKHHLDEVTDRRTAWSEGWAIYNGALFSSKTRSALNEAIYRMYLESPDSSKDDPIGNDLVNPHMMTRLRNEGTVAAIFTNIDASGQYRDQILETMKKSNQNWRKKSLSERDIVTFTQEYMKAYPDQTIRTMLAIDSATLFRADDKRLRKLFGVQAEEYLNKRASFISEFHRATRDQEKIDMLQFFATLDKELESGEIVESVPATQRETSPEVRLEPMTLVGTSTS